MSVCEIDIHFDKEKRTYYPGETVSGEVIVRPNKEITCRKIVLYLGGSGQSKVLTTLFNRETVWEEGVDYTYPFKFNAPRGPMTYHGRHISIDWHVRATANIPFSKERLLAAQLSSPSSTANFVLTSDRPLRFSRKSIDSLSSALNELPTQLWLIFVLVVMIGGSVVAFRTLTRPEPSILPLLLAMIATVAGLYILVRYLPVWLAELRLGHVEVGFSALPRNEGMTGLIRFTPRMTGQIHRIEMTLLIREIVVEERESISIDGVGGTKVHKHTVFKGKVAETQVHRIREDEPFEIELALKSDSPLPASYGKGGVGIVWLVTINIILTRWAKWRRKIPVEATY